MQSSLPPCSFPASVLLTLLAWSEVLFPITEHTSDSCRQHRKSSVVHDTLMACSHGLNVYDVMPDAKNN